MKINRAIVIGAVLVIGFPFSGQRPVTMASPVLQAMNEELAQTLKDLKSQPTPPYFLSYGITENREASVSGLRTILRFNRPTAISYRPN